MTTIHPDVTFANGNSARASLHAESMERGILVITGPRASGKTRLAAHLLMRRTEVPRVNRSQPTREEWADPRLIPPGTSPYWIDDVRTKTPGGRRRRPIDSPPLLEASRHRLIILCGESIDLSPDLERAAIRIELEL